MPTYVYRCENDHQFEAVQRMSDDPLTSCELCEAPAKRVLFAPAIHFKGTGFHNTDYGTKKRGARTEGEGGASGGDGASAGGGGGDAGGTSGGDSGGASSGGGQAAGVKQATKADTAKRTTGP